MYPYLAHTDQEIQEMLQKLGLESIDDLFRGIPSEVALDKELDLPLSKSEIEVRNLLTKMQNKNKTGICFLGAGSYDHYIPSIIPTLLSRSEFYTSYTPYQPEISQGTLQVIFEFQTMICNLTGMDVANASVYDGSNAVAEAALMSASYSRKNKILVSEGLYDSVKEVLETYTRLHEIEIEYIQMENGQTSKDDLQAKISDDIAGVIVQSPNSYGILEDIEEFGKITHEIKRAAFIVSTDPISLGILEAPGKLGADIVVGEGQGLGIPMSYGGPYLGFMASTSEYMRKLPGRIAGQTVDLDGKRSFVLTLTAREQHIRRARASSNICSNQGLNTLAASIYMALMGKKGLKEVAAQSLQKAHYLKDELVKTGKMKLVYDAPFFKEFLVEFAGDRDELLRKLLEHDIHGGIKVGKNQLLIAVTEKRTKEEMDQFVKIVEALDD